MKPCRTCLKFTDNENYVQIYHPSDSSLEDMIKEFVCEIDLNLVLDPVLCKLCVNLLNLSCHFKKTCIETERKLKSYFNENDTHIPSDKITFLSEDRATLGIKEETESDIDVTNVEINPRETEIKIEILNEDKDNILIKVENNPIKNDEVEKNSEIVGALYICDLCSVFCNTCADLKTHLENAHGKSIENKIHDKNKCKKKEPSQTKDFLCNYCGKNFQTLDVLRKHLFTHKEKKGVFLCVECGETYKCQSSLYDHRRRKHNPHNVACPICSTIVATASKLKVHILKHTASKQHKCNHCGEMFKYEQTLKVHINTKHLKTKVYKCEDCDKKFMRGDYLQYHVRKYHKNIATVFTCSSCPKTFTSRDNLKNHFHTMHTTDRPYQCDICKRTYALSGLLKRHQLLMHNSSILCNICNKWYKTKSALKNHTCSKSKFKDTKGFPCNKCCKVFEDITQLRDHMKICTQKPDDTSTTREKNCTEYPLNMELTEDENLLLEEYVDEDQL